MRRRNLKRLVNLGVAKERVLEVVRNPDRIVHGRYGRLINRRIDAEDRA
jgi:hypothetical protein